MITDFMALLSAGELDIVGSKVPITFKNPEMFRTPEALIIHNQHLMDDCRLLEACQRAYNMILETPLSSYVPRDIVQMFRNKNVVVVNYDIAHSTIILATIPEFAIEAKKIMSDMYSIQIRLVPIYYYVDLYMKQYGYPDFLVELPVKDKWDFIVQEALSLQASDITVTNSSMGALVYYNVRKKKVPSERALNEEDVENLIHILASSAQATIADKSAIPRYFAIDINQNYRGRVVVNRTYYGQLMTIRVLSNSLHSKTLEDLNIRPGTQEFIRQTMLSTEKGLRLFIGETMSGKNTTILTALCELVHKGIYKIVSLEQPVEILVDGIEQINAETDEEFALNADSLLRQNPDIVYFTEVTGRTATAIMQQANTAKSVFSTVHANSISDVIYRLVDITGMPADRIIMTLHSCVFQELVRDEKSDRVYPYTRCVYFSDQLKMELYGKSIKEVVGILQGEENRWKEDM